MSEPGGKHAGVGGERGWDRGGLVGLKVLTFPGLGEAESHPDLAGGPLGGTSCLVSVLSLPWLLQSVGLKGKQVNSLPRQRRVPETERQVRLLVLRWGYIES